MKPFGIIINAGARLALRMPDKADGFRTGKILGLIMPDEACVASTMNEDEFHPNTCNTPWRIIFMAIAARKRLTILDVALTPPAPGKPPPD